MRIGDLLDLHLLDLLLQLDAGRLCVPLSFSCVQDGALFFEVVVRQIAVLALPIRVVRPVLMLALRSRLVLPFPVVAVVAHVPGIVLFGAVGAQEEVGWGFDDGGFGGQLGGLWVRDDAILVSEGDEVLFHGSLLEGADECFVEFLAEEVVNFFLDILALLSQLHTSTVNLLNTLLLLLQQLLYFLNQILLILIQFLYLLLYIVSRLLHQLTHSLHLKVTPITSAPLRPLTLTRAPTPPLLTLQTSLQLLILASYF